MELFMQFEGRRRSSLVPNMTPLIDIVFLLLVFFMLTSHFVKEERIALELPNAESGSALEEKKHLEVVIDAEGKIMIDNRIVEITDLDAVLGDALEKRDEKIVRIRGDHAATLGRAVTIMDAARKANAQAVDIVTENK
jgi:biopolymer transport protein ExbD